MTRIGILLVCAGLLAPSMARGDGPPKLALADGDRVVLIGNAFIERDQAHGYLETFLTATHPDKAITFRNLGWSGDTVFGEARAGFGTAAEGFWHLKEHVLALRPTVLVLGYGMNESFEGRAGLSRFVAGLNALLDALAETRARVVLLSPIRHEDLGRPLPDPARHNEDLGLYRDAIRDVAESRGHRFVDLFEALGDGAGPPLTDDGIHLTPHGYWKAAAVIGRGLGLDPRPWHVVWTRSRITPPVSLATRGAEAEHLFVKDGGRVAWKLKVIDTALPPPPPPTDAPAGATWPRGKRLFQVAGLEPGRYVLKVDDQPVATASHDEWAAGVALTKGPEFDQVERLRKAISEKNLLYFHRWRPQNETYLFGFRKHEQGQNAREIPRFDPLIAAEETKIAKLRVPVSHTYELILED